MTRLPKGVVAASDRLRVATVFQRDVAVWYPPAMAPPRIAAAFLQAAMVPRVAMQTAITVPSGGYSQASDRVMRRPTRTRTAVVVMAVVAEAVVTAAVATVAVDSTAVVMQLARVAPLPVATQYRELAATQYRELAATPVRDIMALP